MFAVEIRPSLRILQQVAAIERFCGGWDRIASQTYFADPSRSERKMLEGIAAAAELDQSTPPSVLLQLRELLEQFPGSASESQTFAYRGVPEKALSNGGFAARGYSVNSGVNSGAYDLPDDGPVADGLTNGHAKRSTEPLHPELKALFTCHRSELRFTPALVELCQQALCGETVDFQGLYANQPEGVLSARLTALGLEDYALLDGLGSDLFELDTARLRRQAARFVGPGNEVLFQTVPAFLVEQRLTDLLDWTTQELEAGRYHPLLIGGVFFLLFLQISPYERANHRLAVVLLFHFLEHAGYSFIRHNHVAAQFNRSAAQYLSALRQAEKSAYGNWSTLNVWLEFFLQSLCVCCEELENATEKSSRQSRLSSVQRDIIEVIRTCGSATRERIVKDTGINISTVKYNLTVLSARGHLRREGGGRSTSYTLL